VHVLGPALQMSGDLEGAREVIGQRLAAAERQGDAFVVWTESANLSMVERQLGNLDRAGELSRQAVDTETAREHDLYLGWTLNGLAAVAAAKGESVRAATVLGAAASLLERGGGEWPPDELEQFEETEALLGRALPPDEPCRRTSSTKLAPRGLPCPASRPSRTPCRRAAVSNVPYDAALDCAVDAAKGVAGVAPDAPGGAGPRRRRDARGAVGRPAGAAGGRGGGDRRARAGRRAGTHGRRVWQLPRLGHGRSPAGGTRSRLACQRLGPEHRPALRRSGGIRARGGRRRVGPRPAWAAADR
jgi:hypothetical protein